MMTSRRFLLCWLLSALGIVTAVGAFNLLVDPYLVFDSPRHAGFNADKPASETREALMRAHQVLRVSPHTVLMGSSRTGIGLNPADPAWPQALQPVYSLGMAGHGVEGNLRYLRHMLTGPAQPKVLIIGLDFEDFLTELPQPPAPLEPGPGGARTEVAADGSAGPSRSLQFWKDRITALFSLDALLDSVDTVRGNRQAGRPGLLADGRLSDAQLRGWTASDGVAVIFAQKHASVVRSFSKSQQVLRERPDAPMFKAAPVEALMTLAQQRGMRLIIALQPAHAQRTELLAQLGYWPAFESWKQEMTQIVARGRARGVDVQLWDFADYSSWTTEVVPARSAGRAGLRWFWDPVHYRTELGHLMIERMLGTGQAYGTLLEPANIEQHLANVRADRERYRQAHAAELQTLQTLR